MGREKLARVIKLILSRKGLEYRALKFAITITVSWLFFGHPFKSIEFALTLAFIMTIVYGIHEYRHDPK